jgi:hypothetical protein
MTHKKLCESIHYKSALKKYEDNKKILDCMQSILELVEKECNLIYTTFYSEFEDIMNSMRYQQDNNPDQIWNLLHNTFRKLAKVVGPDLAIEISCTMRQ